MITSTFSINTEKLGSGSPLNVTHHANTVNGIHHGARQSVLVRRHTENNKYRDDKKKTNSSEARTYYCVWQGSR